MVAASAACDPDHLTAAFLDLLRLRARVFAPAEDLALQAAPQAAAPPCPYGLGDLDQ